MTIIEQMKSSISTRTTRFRKSCAFRRQNFSDLKTAILSRSSNVSGTSLLKRVSSAPKSCRKNT